MDIAADKSPESEFAVALAERVARQMMQNDRCAKLLGITIDSIGPGTARLSMVVREEMLNGHGICHGGLLYTLADTAFAYAANSENRSTLTSSSSIDYLLPARCGDVLSAVAGHVSDTGRVGLYQVKVFNQDQRLLAHYWGRGYRLSSAVVPSET